MTAQAPTYTQTRWSLTDLFPSADSPEMQSAFTSLEAKVAAFEGRRSDLTPDISEDRFHEIIKEMETITMDGYRIYGFSNLWFSEDTQNQKAQMQVGKVRQFFAGIQNRTLFFSLWWKALDDENAARLMANAGDYRYWLQEMRNFKPHTLAEAEEKIINIKDVTGSQALITLYDTITNRYVFKVEVDGEVKELTRGQLMALVYSPDADLRARAYQELYRVYTAEAPILGQIYQSVVRDWRNENVDLRKFSSPISVRNLYNDIADEAIETLLAVTRQNAGIFQRFFKLKARLIGMEKLRRYDIYAPVTQAKKAYEYSAAAQMVFDSFEKFHPDFAALARKVFASGHVDSEVRKGKQSGAFCASLAPGLEPWVLLNYQGQAGDVSTMAHELGHAIHALLAGHLPIFTYHSALPLAETASTFGEMLLIDTLLATEKDADVRRDILFQQVSDAYATIMRQAFFAMFEKEAHEMIAKDASLEDINKMYFENLKTQFGDAVEIGEEFHSEWVSIPHFYHTPFYVYAYAFGQLLVLSLYQQYQAEGQAFVPKLMGILSAGGSASPHEILEKAGIDIRSAAFWQGGFDVIDRLVTELEALPAA